MPPDPIALAQAVCTRLCHDLGGPVGAMAGALEMIEGEHDDAMDLARDAALILDRRIRFFRAAVGAGSGDCRVEDIAQMAEGLTLGRRVTVDLSDLSATSVFPAHLAQAVLLGAWAATDALPKGGAVRLGGDAENGFSIWPDGPGAAWPQGLAAGLAGDDVPANPRGIAIPLLLALAEGSGIRLDLLMGAGGGAPPLLLAPRTRN